MRKFLLISFALSLVLLTKPAVAADEDCDQGSHAENSECVGLRLNIVDQEMKATYNAIRGRLAANTRTDRYAAEAGRRLIKSQDAWEVLRAADCSLEGAEMLGGNGEGLRIQRCELAKTHERLLRLHEVSF